MTTNVRIGHEASSNERERVVVDGGMVVSILPEVFTRPFSTTNPPRMKRFYDVYVVGALLATAAISWFFLGRISPEQKKAEALQWMSELPV